MYSHKNLVEIAAKWLKGQGAKLVLTEPKPGCAVDSYESPDAIGWFMGFRYDDDYVTTVVECKVSVSDYKANEKKKHLDMGTFRYLMITQEVFDQITKGGCCINSAPYIGILVVNAKGKVQQVGVDPNPRTNRNRDAEYNILFQALRKAVGYQVIAGLPDNNEYLDQNYGVSDADGRVSDGR